jgi:DNA modification methylase
MPQRNELILGNCIEIMRSMPDKSVDLVFGSPPYESQRTYGIGFNLKGQDWVDWMVEVYRESSRICRGLVAFVVAGHTKNFKWSATPALLMADLHRAGFNLRKPLMYKRFGIPGSGSVDWMRSDYEFVICVAPLGRLNWSDNKAMGHSPKWGPGGECSHRIKDGTRVNQWGHIGKGQKESGNRRADGTRETMDRPSHQWADKDSTPIAIANPGDVIDCGALGGGHLGSKLAHENEAPFSEKVAEFFIRSFCPPGGIVLDCFCGSGTVPAVAIKTGRNYIGIDIRQSQIELGTRRIEEARQWVIQNKQKPPSESLTPAIRENTGNSSTFAPPLASADSKLPDSVTS